MVVSGRLMFVLLAAVNIVKSQGQAPPNTGLYFTLNGTVYLPGDTILITDISNTTDGNKNPQSSLVCVTTNVRTHCCRGADNPNGGGRGEWYLPNGTRLLNTKENFYRSRYTQQVRLNRGNNAMSPTGIFTCEVPNNMNTTNHTATIRIVTVLPQLNVMLTGSEGTPTVGQNYMLTCAASGGRSLAYTYMWLKDNSVVSGQTSSTYSFSPLMESDFGQYSCQVSVDSRNRISEAVTITVVVIPTTGATLPSTSPTTTTTTTSTTTTIPPLTVRIVSSNGTLRAGQNHMLKCEASGGEFMEYTYMWLKDGSVVSGQTSSTYSFSPLLVVHSGQYSCQVSTLTSESVDITVERTATQLYFTWRGNRYEPGDSILITDIRLHEGDAGAGDSLVCVTTSVNTQCCTDEGEGQWYFPNGSIVLRNINNGGISIIRTGRTNQLRLNFRTRQTSPTGEYTCVVPETGGSVNQAAGIKLVTVLPQLNVTLTGRGGTLTEGQHYVLTCDASGDGSMVYTYMWFKDGSVVSSQNSSTYSFSHLRETDSGQYRCQVSVGSRNMTSKTVTITVVAVTTTSVTTEEPTSVTTEEPTSVTTEEPTSVTTVEPTSVTTEEPTSVTTEEPSTSPPYTTVATTITSSVAVTTEEPSTSPPQTTVAATIPPLTVRIVSSGGTLRAGQNHTLTCEASGGGPMEYTYIWLKDGSVISGQISSTYSFSPLEKTDSGRYSCQVSLSSRNMRSETVIIVVGLYFKLNGTVYLPGDTIHITGIGSTTPGNDDPKSSLVCVTTNVNTHCCSGSDNPVGGGRGEWYLPDRTKLLNTKDTNFYRTRSTQQVHLNRRNNAMSPTGVFTCEIPNDADSTMPFTATITIVTMLPPLNVTLTGSGGTPTEGQDHVLTCEASGGRSLVYTYMWLKDGIVVFGQTSSTYTFFPLKVTDSGRYSCRVSIGSRNMTSEAVTIAVVAVITEEPSSSPPTTTVTTTITSSVAVTTEEPSTNPLQTTVAVTIPSLTVRIVSSDGTLRAGQNHVLTCEASGGGSMEYIYTWLKNSSIVSGQTSSTYSFSPLLVVHSGRYSCRVSVGSMTVTSEGVNITVEMTDTQLYFTWRGDRYEPGDSILITDVGLHVTSGDNIGPGDSLVCVTTNVNTQCCNDTGDVGEWFFPNGSMVLRNIDDPNRKSQIIRTGRANQVRLNFRTRQTSPTGEYTCVVPETGGSVIQTAGIQLVTDDVPSSPSNLRATMHNATSITITWTETTTMNIDRYEVTYSYTVRRCSASASPAMTNNITSTSRSHTLMNLNEDSTYTIIVRNINGAASNMARITANTATAVPSAGPSSVTPTTVGTARITIEWSELDCADRNGDITGYRVRYGPTSTTPSQRQIANIRDPGRRMFTVDREFITLSYVFEVAAVNVNGTGPYSTPPLTVNSTGPSSTSVAVHPRGEEDGGGGNIAAVVVSVTVLFLVVAIITAILIFTWYKRWWRQDKYSQQDIPLKEMGLEQIENSDEIKEGEQDERDTVFIDQEWLKPVPVDMFPERVQQMHEDREKKFELEYNAIEKSPQASYNTAVILENRVRNRFGNIFPYDFNRVILESKPGELNSDYINASYIDGYQRRKMYIAAQGPTENSLEDFWRMIWEQHVPTIVMLTKVYEERKKCEQYWPENADTPFVPVSGSPLSIQYNFVLPFPEFTIREMTVTNSDEPGTAPLTVTLYHYLGWPDHGVPANAISMVNFVKRVRMSHPYSRQDLLLVHCSAGVGRTGTFITLDSMLERINVEKSINIFEFVTNLRKQRVLMVQTLVQYVFIHDALEELLTCGETEIAAGDIRIVIGKLTAPIGPQDTIGFSKQFEILEKVSSKGKNVECSDATIDPNIPKNRYEKILPYNYTRVHLRPSAAYGSDYINASFIEGYRQKGVYIATQGPLPYTVNDFWRMIWEQEVRCIVMLCKTEENGEEVCHQYWPLRNGCCETFGKYIVTLTSEEEEEDYIIRKIDILEKQSKTSISQSGFTVTQIQYEKWPEDNVPETTMTILEIANFVQKVQMGSGNKPIVVMCNNGIGRSGAFICMHSQMERMKAEAMVNIFQFIKAVRIQRAGLVTTEEQYEFCHHVLADFLDGFDTYANFKEII